MTYKHFFEPILQPFETQFAIEAWLGNTKNLFTPTYCGDYYFTFVPNTTPDIMRLDEMAQRAYRDCLLYGKSWETEPKLNIQLKDDTYFVQQPKSFASIKTNLEDERMIELVNEAVSLTLHFHDSPDGKIYLSCDWVNAYLPSNEEREQQRLEEMANEKNPPCDIDW